MLYLFILGAVVLGAGGMLYAVMTLFQSGNEEIEDRLTSLTQNAGRGAATSAVIDKPSLLMGPLDESKGGFEELLNKYFPLSAMLTQSGTGIEPAQLGLMTLAFGGVAGVLSFLFVPPAFKLLSIFAVLLAAPLPLVYVWWKRNKRLDNFGAQLPAAMDLMGQALRAGQSLPSAIQLVAEQMAEPLGPEFQTAFEQQNLGVTISDSLKDMTERVPNLDLRFFATAVILQRQTGGDLAEILDKIGHLTRERFQIKGQIQALTGEGRISGIVLLGLPPVLFIVMLRLNYDYVMTLFEHELGQWMLGGAILLQFVGAFAIKKIIDIKV